MSPEAVRERESRWAAPAAAVAFGAVALMIASVFVGAVGGGGDAAILRSIHDHKGAVIASGVMQALGFALLAAPLAYLFQAGRARSERVRPQLIALMVAAPLLLGISTGLAIGARREAADQFVGGEAKSTLSPKEAREKCVSERKGEGAKAFGEEFEPAKGETALAACEGRKIEDEEASNALGEASLAPWVSACGIIGGLGFAVGVFYCCLWAMRTGLLSRFWGALGMALGIATLLGLVLFTLIWFVYLGLLIAGFLPGGRPPAWESGEAQPWPTPGERAAAEMEPKQGPEPEDAEEPAEKRKRKERS